MFLPIVFVILVSGFAGSVINEKVPGVADFTNEVLDAGQQSGDSPKH